MRLRRPARERRYVPTLGVRCHARPRRPPRVRPAPWIKFAEQRRWECDADAQRMANVPGQARALGLGDVLCADRTDSSAHCKPYSILRSAGAPGWARVVEKWSAAGCYTEHDRIAAVRARQADPELKFGDIKLFGALAADDAVCVWGDPSAPRPQILLYYAAATEAAYDCWRYKVRPTATPTRCYTRSSAISGNSRWSITFAAHKRPTEMDLRHRVTLRLFTGSHAR